MQVNFVTQTYESRSKPQSAQRLVNMYAEAMPSEARTNVSLFPCSGLKSFTTVGNGPLRGAFYYDGVMFVISGAEVYTVNGSGGTGLVGTITQSGGKVDISPTLTGFLIVEENGDGHSVTKTSVTKISDADYTTTGSSSTCFIDGYSIHSKPDSGQFFISALNDPTAYTGTNFATAEASPDNLVRVFADRRELWLIGEKTIEVWINTGASAFPFQRISGAFIQRGCAAKFSVASDGVTIYWLGDDYVIYRANGYNEQRISTHPIEEEIRKFAKKEDAEAFTYSENGHKFYCITFPTGKKTYCYDITTGLWHEKETRNANRWRGSSFTEAFGKNYVCDYTSNVVYELDPDTYDDNSDEIERRMTSAPLFDDFKRFVVDVFRLDIETGVGITTGQGSNPTVWLEVSNDGGKTWGNMLEREIGKIGKYSTIVEWRCLGQGDNFVFRVHFSDPCKFVVNGAYVEGRVRKV